jgi:hypothetical protein
MISSEVQRTLVKSPPELWAELSDPAALARHLGELGEIRIVRTEPESTVEWEAQNTTGVVSIKPSGWGTKVTLSVTSNLAGPEPADTTAESETPPEGPPAAISDGEVSITSDGESPATGVGEAPVTSEGGSQATGKGETPDTAHESAAAAEPADEPEPRRGFFARLFARRRRSAVSAAPIACDAPVASAEARSAAEGSADQPDAFTAVTQALTPESIAATDLFTPPAPKPLADISAELMAAEEVAPARVTAEEVTAVLTAVLDRLGAAHHRPFSRS